MIFWRLTWALVVITLVNINDLVGQAQSQPKQNRANRVASERSNKSSRHQSSDRRAISELFNFECGKRFLREENEEERFKRFISAGYNAGLYRFPSYMKIMVSVGGSTYTKCGGTLISRQHIITATHCFPRGHREVFAESTIYQRPAPARLPVARVCHLGVRASDVTILRLARPVTFTRSCQPACLPDKPLSAAIQATTVGLGANHISRWNTNNLRNPDQLQALPVRVSPCKPGDRNRAHICFRPSSEKFVGASCKGDSGGPTYAIVDGKQIVYSVVSYGSNHICEPGTPGYSVNGNIYNLKNPIINLMRTC